MAKANQEPTPIGPTISALLRTIAANVDAFGEDPNIPIRDLVSPAEIKLLESLRAEGLEPEQQYRLGYYYADFYFPAERLCVEVDGKHHRERGLKDLARDRELWKKGIKTMRIPAGHVLMDVKGCARAVRSVLDELAVKTIDA